MCFPALLLLNVPFTPTPAQLLCQAPGNEGSPLVADIMKILYATEDGFVAPEDAEEEPAEF